MEGFDKKPAIDEYVPLVDPEFETTADELR